MIMMKFPILIFFTRNDNNFRSLLRYIFCMEINDLFFLYILYFCNVLNHRDIMRLLSSDYSINMSHKNSFEM